MALEKLLKDLKKNRVKVQQGVGTPRQVLAPLVDEYYLKLPADKHGNKGTISPSGLGGCKRALYYAYVGTPRHGSLETSTQLIFSDGTYRHLRWEEVFRNMGKYVDIEVVGLEEYNRNTKTHIGGTYDMWVRVGGVDYIVDFKGMQSRYFYPLIKGGSIGRQYLLQIHAYLHLTDVQRYIFWVECKNTNETYELVGEKDPEVMEEVLQIAEDIRYARLDGVPPGRGFTKSTYQCKSCYYSHKCWKEAV